MILFPNAKINLGLKVLRKRDDGFHDLETIFYPVKFNDALELIEDKDPHGFIKFSVSGLPIMGNEEDNLCTQAYYLLKRDFPQLPPVKIHLHKAIPMGAGLGGGSADGAFVLKILNEKFNLNLSIPQLLNYAAALGSDGPFFIINRPCFATGRGDILEEIQLNLSAYKIILINPGIHISTAWAFSQLEFAMGSDGYKHSDPYNIIQQPIHTWKDTLHNDFETPVFAKYPEIKKAKEQLYNDGAIYASMSGSGSTVFGIFGNAVSVVDNAVSVVEPSLTASFERSRETGINIISTTFL